MSFEGGSGPRGWGAGRSEGQAGAEHVLDEWRRGHQVLELEIEDALQALHGQRAQLRQRAQHAAEVRRTATTASAAAAWHVCTQTSYYLHLQLLHTVRLLETVSICRQNNTL